MIHHILLFITLFTICLAAPLAIQTPLSGTIQETALCGLFGQYTFIRTDKNLLYIKDSVSDTVKKVLHPGSERPLYVSNFFKSKADNSTLIFVGAEGSLWVTTNCASSLHSINPGFAISHLQMHIRVRDWILVSSPQNCSEPNCTETIQRLYLTQDLGETWVLLKENVLHFEWATISESQIAAGIPLKRIFVQVVPKLYPTRLELVSSDDFFGTQTVLMDYCQEFVLTEVYLFAVQQHEYMSPILYQSALVTGFKKFDKAEFFPPVNASGFLVLEATTAAVFIMVTKEENYGDVYVASSTGTRYMKSLENCVKGEAEFFKVEGVEGVYVANVFNEPEKGVNSVITFNYGKSWNYLKPPRVDSKGKRIDNCTDGCVLNLQLIKEGMPAIYSKQHSHGIVVANGNTGQSLSNNFSRMNTYASFDAGATWIEVAEGPHLFTTTHYGSILVLASMTSTKKGYIDIKYTAGNDWKTLQITGEYTAEEVYTGINSTWLDIVKPDTTFNLSEMQSSILSLSLNAMDIRKCTDDEYETWSQPECVNGRRISYTRRKPRAECILHNSLDSVKGEEPCECTENDYEYNEKLGYRKTKGNVCRGGKMYDSGISGDITVIKTGKVLCVLGIISVLLTGVYLIYAKSDHNKRRHAWKKYFPESSREEFHLIITNSANNENDGLLSQLLILSLHRIIYTQNIAPLITMLQLILSTFIIQEKK
eukprot:TRINITY_DN71096_c0_g1_i1.p1 TRINITY_DN71096_c0_g1~~TRINITY_DN71096_c0_g1_i1.p1  ORF type:complete len:708 (-),score=24.72 TRINITY_DN71096_c0_g1_i1:1565-3688(-)